MARKVQVEITGDSSDLKRAFVEAKGAVKDFAGEVKQSSRSAQTDVDALAGSFDKIRREGRSTLTGRGFRQAASGALAVAGGTYALTAALDGASVAAAHFTGENSDLTHGLSDAAAGIKSLVTLDIAGFWNATQASATRAKEALMLTTDEIKTAGDVQKALANASTLAALGMDKEAEAQRKAAASAQAMMTAQAAALDMQRAYNTSIIDGTAYLVAFKGAHDSVFPGTVAGGARALPSPTYKPTQGLFLSPSERRENQLIGTQGMARIPLLQNRIKQDNALLAAGVKLHSTYLRITNEIATTEAEIAAIKASQNASDKAARDAAAAEAERLRNEAAARARRERASALAKEQARQFRLIGLGPGGDEIIPTKSNLRTQLSQLTARKGEISPKLYARFAGISKALKQDITPETRAAIRDFFAMVRSEFDKGGDKLKPFAVRGVNTNQITRGLGLTPAQARALRNRLSGVNVKGQALAPSAGIGAYGVRVGGTTVVTSDVYLDGEKVGRVNRRFAQRSSIRSPTQKRGPNAGR